MWYPASVSVLRASEPITIDQVKQVAAIDDEERDDLITRQIAAARAHAEAYCGQFFSSQTVVTRCDSFSDMARLEAVPLISVTSIECVAPDGSAVTVSSSVYEARTDGMEASIVLKDGRAWPATRRGSRITLTAVVGYTEAPEDVVNALLIFVAAMFNDRENAKAEAWTMFDVMLCNHRRGV